MSSDTSSHARSPLLRCFESASDQLEETDGGNGCAVISGLMELEPGLSDGGRTAEFSFCLYPILYVVSMFAFTGEVEIVGATGWSARAQVFLPAGESVGSAGGFFHAQANDGEVLVRITGEHHPRSFDVFLFMLTDDAVAL
jgi:hypothetical protein